MYIGICVLSSLPYPSFGTNNVASILHENQLNYHSLPYSPIKYKHFFEQLWKVPIKHDKTSDSRMDVDTDG